MKKLQAMQPTAEDELRQISRRVVYAAGAFGALLVIGTIGYRIISPDATFIDALYMTVITLTTVGYGEIVDLSASPGGRVFTVFLLVFGFGTATYFISSATALVVEGHLNHVFWKRRMQKEIAQFAGHYIVCGSSEAAVHAAAELEAVGREVVMICAQSEQTAHLRSRLPTATFLIGDPGSEGALMEAAIDRAAGLVAATDSDNENLVITLTARQAHPKLRIIAQAASRDMDPKLRRVGADSVISPDLIGGLRIASELIRPAAVSFLDQMLRDREANLRVDEVEVPANSIYIGKQIRDIDFRTISNALLLACRGSDNKWHYNPSPDRELDAATVLIMLGTPVDLERTRAEFRRVTSVALEQVV